MLTLHTVLVLRYGIANQKPNDTNKKLLYIYIFNFRFAIEKYTVVKSWQQPNGKRAKKKKTKKHEKNGAVKM